MRRRGMQLSAIASVSVVLLIGATVRGMKPVPGTLPPTDEVGHSVVVARSGSMLGRSERGSWNRTHTIPLWGVPTLLVDALLESEDRRFFSHRGVDWKARGAAVLQNLKARRAVRGASTISEQVVKMLHPRPRTVWTRWLEGWEAYLLERRFSKAQILEFYLNQVPYFGDRRGIQQAAFHYFNRTLDSLTERELLSLVVLVRAPTRLDLRRDPWAVAPAVERLARQLRERNVLEPEQYARVVASPVRLRREEHAERAEHFVRYVRSSLEGGESLVRTTIDAALQRTVEGLLNERVQALEARAVGDAAALVVDHQRSEIRAWANAGSFFSGAPGSQLDGVRILRQPGSALKPFLYALALEQGWTAATMLDDSPYLKAVGNGIHEYNNYSRVHYGPVSLREALGNSLNIPAVRAVDFVGKGQLLARLRSLGFAHLEESAEFYGEGLGLGNGEVTLYELVRAYAALARGGVLRDLRYRLDEAEHPDERRVFSEPIAALIADILADPEARSLEFGRGGPLELPIQTAVKTGTSTGYRDAWAVGFSHQFTVGVWMGNLDGRPMQEVSGSVGPALLLRAIFAELHRHHPQRPLTRSPELSVHTVCAASGLLPIPGCPLKDELFLPSTAPHAHCTSHELNAAPSTPRITQPTENLHLARDPRIPDHLEALAFKLTPYPTPLTVRWELNGTIIATTTTTEYLWPLTPGTHHLRAHIQTPTTNQTTPLIPFTVR